MVVGFLTALKSLIDVAPIAFLKVGQDQGGAIDIELKSGFPIPYRDGDYNQYVDPFAPPTNISASAGSAGGNLAEVDHVELGGLPLLRFDVF